MLFALCTSFGIYFFIFQLHFASAHLLITIPCGSSHGEKPDDKSNNDLTPQGFERANCIAPYFASSPYNITHLFACDPTADYPSKRSMETVTPFSMKSGLPIDLRFDESETSEVAAALMAMPNQEILLAWEHKRIPDSTSGLNFFLELFFLFDCFFFSYDRSRQPEPADLPERSL
jgi:hypothetical protein